MTYSTWNLTYTMWNLTNSTWNLTNPMWNLTNPKWNLTNPTWNCTFCQAWGESKRRLCRLPTPAKLKFQNCEEVEKTNASCVTTSIYLQHIQIFIKNPPISVSTSILFKCQLNINILKLWRRKKHQYACKT